MGCSAGRVFVGLDTASDTCCLIKRLACILLSSIYQYYTLVHFSNAKALNIESFSVMFHLCFVVAGREGAIEWPLGESTV